MYSVKIDAHDVTSFDTPVLLCVFNRPDLTKVALDNLRTVRPKRLYVSADGPRLDVPSDLMKCESVRAQFETIDWPCEVNTRFLTENQGCGRSIAGAIDWFFSHEEQGVILEDDILPVPYFFSFAQEMLERFRSNDKIFMISGTNLYPDTTKNLNYFYTSMPAAWGWATWRRAWKQFDFEMDYWSSPTGRHQVQEKINNRIAQKYLSICFDEVASSNIDTWDYQWQFSGISNSRLGVTAGQNLVTNVGVLGTHSDGVTKSHYLATSQSFRIDSQKCSPVKIVAHKKYERKFLVRRALPVILKWLVKTALRRFQVLKRQLPDYPLSSK
jgi:hypothetical protein